MSGFITFLKLEFVKFEFAVKLEFQKLEFKKNIYTSNLPEIFLWYSSSMNLSTMENLISPNLST